MSVSPEGLGDGNSGKIVVVGFAVTGQAVAKAFCATDQVLCIDDFPNATMKATALGLDVEFVERPSVTDLSFILSESKLIVVSPGVPFDHPVFELAKQMGRTITTELEIGFQQLNKNAQLVGVTGTNGKTSVTTLIALMLEKSGISSETAGNIGIPLIEAVGRSSDVIVVEASSFQLEHTSKFKPNVAVWLNLDQDHLDIHPSMERYSAAKAKIFANQTEGDFAIVNAEDPIVLQYGKQARSQMISFGLEHGDYSVRNGKLSTPDGRMIISAAEMARSFPHDIANGLASSAAAICCGSDPGACGEVLAEFKGLRHRIEFVASYRGVDFFDDSKATTPASVEAALRAFSSTVLIAGGRNKGLDLGQLLDSRDRIKSVVAIGE
ncbi:MAG TPA: UDP-N-acetylmuramoyl-L-alanine--D-glutamate ligase, partial [Acidimicrobiales bacterium]|nr:UDP-N-acetylmuramoyl-L-alanine--D-glutamate ligase [Acidimicrobiales bacterium]